MLEDAIVALTKAVEQNTALMKQAFDAANSRREPASAAAPADPPTTTRRRRRTGAGSSPATFLPPDPVDLTIANFKDYNTSWLGAGDDSEAAAPEREKRMNFLVGVCKHLGIEAARQCEPEDRPIILKLLKEFITNPDVDYRKALPVDD